MKTFHLVPDMDEYFASNKICFDVSIILFGVACLLSRESMEGIHSLDNAMFHDKGERTVCFIHAFVYVFILLCILCFL